jgi:hypothetical protein
MVCSIHSTLQPTKQVCPSQSAVVSDFRDKKNAVRRVIGFCLD